MRRRLKNIQITPGGGNPTRVRLSRRAQIYPQVVVAVEGGKGKGQVGIVAIFAGSRKFGSRGSRRGVELAGRWGGGGWIGGRVTGAGGGAATLRRLGRRDAADAGSMQLRRVQSGYPRHGYTRRQIAHLSNRELLPTAPYRPRPRRHRRRRRRPLIVPPPPIYSPTPAVVLQPERKAIPIPQPPTLY